MANTFFEELMFIVAQISSGFLLVQFFASLFYGDFETDVDLNFESDFNMSDILSFKGILHFIIGFSWTIALVDILMVQRIALAILVGLVFMFVLYKLAKSVKKLGVEPRPFNVDETINKTATVDYWNNGMGEIIYKSETFTTSLKAESKSNKQYKSGETVTIIDIVGDKIYVD